MKRSFGLGWWKALGVFLFILGCVLFGYIVYFIVDGFEFFAVSIFLYTSELSFCLGVYLFRYMKKYNLKRLGKLCESLKSM